VIAIEDVIRVRVPVDIKARFHLALKTNSENAEVIINEAIFKYLEKHEEDAVAEKLHEIADHLKTKKSTYSN